MKDFDKRLDEMVELGLVVYDPPWVRLSGEFEKFKVEHTEEIANEVAKCFSTVTKDMLDFTCYLLAERWVSNKYPCKDGKYRYYVEIMFTLVKNLIKETSSYKKAVFVGQIDFDAW